MTFTVANASKIRGAVYVPARVYNTFQFWSEFDPHLVSRDFSFARTLGLNALRLFVSYECWLADPERLKRDFGRLLTAADEHGLRVMAVLFERCGIEATPETIADRDVRSAVCLRSPHSEIINDRARWESPRSFVRWFMQHWGASDRRLLAVELVNEPHSVDEHKFARAMLATAADQRQDIPLTIGSLFFEDSRLYVDLPLDILQVHENFHRNADVFRARLKRFVETQEILNRPVMVTEWQRLRPGGSGWGDEPVSGDEWQPAYHTMAPILRDYPLGTFFWSLMIKPAYLTPQRKKGTINGVFHEDGAVWSLADARAIANDPKLDLTERCEVPEWMSHTKSSS